MATATMAEAGCRYITHILLEDIAEFWPLYQNVNVQYLHQHSRPFLFARFAWAILLLAKRFVTNSLPRYIIRVEDSTKNGVLQSQ
jgi:hypothetical protein